MFDASLLYLPALLGGAWLLPLAAFTINVFFGPRLGPGGKWAAYVSTGAILGSAILSVAALAIWLGAEHGEAPESQTPTAAAAVEHREAASDVERAAEELAAEEHAAEEHAAEEHGGDHHGDHAAHGPKPYVAGDWYTLSPPGISAKISIGYYIDALTVLMFTMVSIIASCIHFYSMGYMHEELHPMTDHEVTLSDGSHLKRRGRFNRFFQYLSLFCFSMFGIVIAGNVAMVFVFWELVGICSYFLIGFYIERKSASTAANKAFIVNRVGDFGMIIGLMALWGSLGTFSFGDQQETVNEGGREFIRAAKTEQGDLAAPGLFSLIRPEEVDTPAGSRPNHHQIIAPDGMVKAANPEGVETIMLDHVRQAGPDGVAAGRSQVQSAADGWRVESGGTMGYGLLILAGIGIFCGCVGKSAQFPLHVWLPDAMEGPTPVSALVHSATMVAAGVYLVGRFFPVFTPEVLLVIAFVGAITLFIAATIAITAVDIKRVLAYSTVSQLGYMMLALGLGGWVAGLFHLITHAFFKSLLFLCSGSVIHAVHTNDMRQMGGLRKKMPITAYTMLIGCMAIAGFGIPFVIGLSGYYSKDSILAQALNFRNANPLYSLLFLAAVAGAAITAFYMFRLWYMTFCGKPRDEEKYAHAHESPRVMTVPLIVLAFFAVTVGGSGSLVVYGVVTGLAALWIATRYKTGGAAEPDPFAAHPARALEDHGHDTHASHGHETHGHDAHAHDNHGHGHHHHPELPHDPAATRRWAVLLVGAFLVAGILAYAAPLTETSVVGLLEQALPDGVHAGAGSGLMWDVVHPSEHDSHAPAIHIAATLAASATAFGGFLLATLLYLTGTLSPEEIRRQFAGLYNFLWHKWWFDELYDKLFVRPVMFLARLASKFDKRVIDRFIDSTARGTIRAAKFEDRAVDRGLVDGLANRIADWTYSTGLWLRNVQTGRLRQYVVFIVVGTVALFVLISMWAGARAG